MSDDNSPTAAANHLEELKRLQAESRHPAKRMAVDLNINKFKKMIDSSELKISKSQRNQLIKQYKAQGWADFDEMTKEIKFNFGPSRNVVKKTPKGDDNGKQSEQASDLSVA